MQSGYRRALLAILRFPMIASAIFYMEIGGNRRLVCPKAKRTDAVNGGEAELHPKSWTRKSTKGVQKSMGKELFGEELKLAVVQYDIVKIS